jgi:phosphoribosylaminoimidazole-succinocarboxamide synthase
VRRKKVKRLEKLYEGKAKIIYATDDPDLVIHYFKDDATAFNAQKKGTIERKGILNNAISSRLFKYLEEREIPTHFVEQISEREMLTKKLEIIPVEVVARNIVAGSLAQRLGIAEGTPLKETVLEFYYKDDSLGDPMINEYHIKAFNYATEAEIAVIKKQTLKVNSLLKDFFNERGILLIDFKLEFGRHKGHVFLGDEVTPDGCRFWDKETGEKMDKDRFRRDLGKVEEGYQDVYKRVCGK